MHANLCTFTECLIIMLARSLVRAEPSLLSKLEKLPSRAWLGSLNHRAAPSRLGSARFQPYTSLSSVPRFNCWAALGRATACPARGAVARPRSGPPRGMRKGRHRPHGGIGPAR
jgi:hypothetical protein